METLAPWFHLNQSTFPFVEQQGNLLRIQVTELLPTRYIAQFFQDSSVNRRILEVKSWMPQYRLLVEKGGTIRLLHTLFEEQHQQTVSRLVIDLIGP